MMASDRIGNKFGHAAVVPRCQAAQDRRPCGGVIDPDVFALQSALKVRVVFAKVMKQARNKGGLFDAKFHAELRRQLRDRPQMIGQGLPVGLVDPICGVRVELIL